MPWWKEPDYVGKEALQNLKHYKYGAADKSYLSYYILQPYWSWAVTLFPMWMAPNLITLVGFGFMVANLLLCLYCMPDLAGPAEPWVYFSIALGFWLYSTFDNVDGKQARRTGSSSPLGELFDHGCDALNCSVGGILQSAAMGFGNTWLSIYVPFIAIIAFFFSTWEEYHTGILYLGHINGPTEGLVLCVIIISLSGWYGPAIWTLPLRQFTPSLLASYIPSGWTLTTGLAAMMFMLLVFFQIPTSLYMVYQARRKKKLPFMRTLPQFIPMAVFSIFGYLWLSAPHSHILKRDVAIFVLTMGIAFGRIAIILAYVTKMEYPYFTIMLYPLIFGALIANAPNWFGLTLWTAQGERFYLYAYFLFVVVAYLHWALVVIDRFCTHLKIKCLSIPYKATTPKLKRK